MFGRFRRVAVGIFVVCIFHLCPLVTGFRPGDFSLFNVSQVGAGSRGGYLHPEPILEPLR